MGWLSNIIAGREIGRLEELIISSPAPSLYLRLCQLLSEQGQVDKARDIIHRGCVRFPESDQLKQAAQRLRQSARGAEIEGLKAKIERFPNPTLYARLAKTLLEDGDEDQAMTVCHSALKAFPSYGGIYLVISEVHQKANRLPEALESLEKAVDLDKYNYAALLLLAESLMRSNRLEEAREKLDRILEFAPGDERALFLLKNLEKGIVPEGGPPAKGQTGKMSKTTVVSINPPAEPKQETAKVKTAIIRDIQNAAPPGNSVPGEMTRILKEMVGVPGIEAGLIIDQYGLVVASAMREGLDEELAAALITNTYRAVGESTVGLGVGDFEEANVDSESGSISMLARGETILAVLAGSAVKAGMLQMAIRNCAQQLDKVVG